MKSHMFRSLMLLLLVFGCPGALLAQDPAAGSGPFSSDQPIEVTADRLEGNQQLGHANFFGHVVAKQGDVTIHAEEMTIYAPPATNEIEKIVARHAVRIVQGERVATAEQAVYHKGAGTVVLTGSPQVHQGQDLIKGDEITVFLMEERSVVTGKEGGRVNAVFHSRGQKP